MKSDDRLKRDVTPELAWDPAVNSDAIGVAAENGVVTLTGQLNSFAEKFAIERALRRVQGVRAIALGLDVKLSPRHRRNDTELAPDDVSERIEQALQRQVEPESKQLHVDVTVSTVTLHGTMHGWSERQAAAVAAGSAPGVRSVVSEQQVSDAHCGAAAA